MGTLEEGTSDIEPMTNAKIRVADPTQKRTAIARPK